MSDLARSMTLLNPKPEQHLTVQEYADRYRMHVQSVYKAIQRGAVPHKVIRVGRTIRIDITEESHQAV